MKDDMNTLDKLRKGLKTAIKNSGKENEYELPMDPAFFDNLHDNIMAKIAETTIEPAPAMLAPRRFLRAHWREWLYPAGGTMALVLVVTLIAMQAAKWTPGHSPVAQLNPSGEKVVAAVIASQDALALALVSSQTEADFFVDVASQSFENLNISQLNKIMGEKSQTQR